MAMLVLRAGFKIVDQFFFVGLPFKDLARFIRADHFFLEAKAAFDDLAHIGFDLFQVLRRQGARQVKVVIKTVLDRRPDGNFGVREFFQHCLRHDMRGGVAQFVNATPRIFLQFFCHFYAEINKIRPVSGAEADSRGSTQIEIGGHSEPRRGEE